MLANSFLGENAPKSSRIFSHKYLKSKKRLEEIACLDLSSASVLCWNGCGEEHTFMNNEKCVVIKIEWLPKINIRVAH